MQRLVTNSGHSLTDCMESADIIVINSCTVTGESDRKTRQAVRRFKRNNPTCTVVLTGCLPQAFKDDAISLAEADILLLGNESQTVGPEHAPMAVHQILLSADVVLLEGIRLADVTEGVNFLNAAPLNLSGADGSPCRAVLIEAE